MYTCTPYNHVEIIFEVLSVLIRGLHARKRVRDVLILAYASNALLCDARFPRYCV